MPTEIELLTTLREAAQRGDWNACCDATKVLLSRLTALTMLRIAHAEVQRRLPIFERNQPHMHWPRVWLEALATGAPFTFDESTPEVLEEAPGPGGNSFVEAVQQLARAAAAGGESYTKHVMEAIACGISSERTEAGGSKHRELWDRWFQDATTTHEGSYSWVLEKIAREPETVAAELAAALGVQG